MPTRTFDQLDVINIVEGYTVGPATFNSTFNLSNTSFSDFGISGIGNNVVIPPLNAASVATATYRKTGNFDFTIFPGIPPDALITKVVYTLGGHASADVDATTPGGGGVNGVTINLAQCPTANTSGLSDSGENTHATLTYSQGGVIPSTQNFDPPLDFATFNATYSPVSLIVAIDVHSSSQGGATTCNSTHSFNCTCTDLSIEVTYFQQFQFLLHQPENPVDTGDDVDVTSDPNDPSAIDFSQVTGVFVDGVPATFTVDGNNHLVFVIPAITKGIVIVTITSTQFSGSVTLGKLMTILFLNASGIYQLFPGKSNDTIYDADNGGTFDAKIPNPTAKTGFLP